MTKSGHENLVELSWPVVSKISKQDWERQLSFSWEKIRKNHPNPVQHGILTIRESMVKADFANARDSRSVWFDT